MVFPILHLSRSRWRHGRLQAHSPERVAVSKPCVCKPSFEKDQKARTLKSSRFFYALFEGDGARDEQGAVAGVDDENFNGAGESGCREGDGEGVVV